jgi:hypothetical protein
MMSKCSIFIIACVFSCIIFNITSSKSNFFPSTYCSIKSKSSGGDSIIIDNVDHASERNEFSLTLRNPFKTMLSIRAGASKKKGVTKKSKSASKSKKTVKKVETTDEDTEENSTGEEDASVEEESPKTTEITTENEVTSPPSPAGPTDFAQAILKRINKPNMLLVDDAHCEDHSSVAMNPAKMEELGLFLGDLVLLKGKKKMSTIALVQSDDKVSISKIKMSKQARGNLQLRL